MKLVYALVCVFLANFGLAKEMIEETDVQETLRELTIGETANNTSVSETWIDIWQESASDIDLDFAGGMVSQKCLECICKQESGCRGIGCVWDQGSYSCGYFQIKETYWKDCGRPGSSWRSCALNKMCASRCVQNYMKRYARWARCPLRCEGFAREHNGGPRGCKNRNTLKYWNELQSIKGCRGVR